MAKLTEHFRYTPPWRLSRWGWGWPFPGRGGGDEWHNHSWVLYTPLGMLAWWPRIRFPRVDGLEHIHGRTGDEYWGMFVPGCEDCAEVFEALSN